MKKKNQALDKSQKLVKQSGEYQELLKNLSSLIEEGRRIAVRQINTTLVATYWRMGRWIVEYEQQGKERAEYGEALIRKLSYDLTRWYGKGWGENLLLDIRQFYLTYRRHGKPHTVCGELTDPVKVLTAGISDFQVFQRIFPLFWSHYRLLMRMEDPEKRIFYENLSVQEHWSVRQLDREINVLLYERTTLSKRKELVLARANENVLVTRPEDEVRDSYVLDFLGLKNEYSESDLEDALIRHIETFLLELGRGFTFVARQRRFVLDGDEYRIDLLLFNISLKAYIVAELKLTKFTHAHAGQTNFYLNWVKDNLLPHAENDPIGIILCPDKNNTTVKYATGGLNNKIFVSKYLLELPKPEEFKREIERGRNLFFQNQVHLESPLNHEKKVRSKGGKE